ncbi:MAG: dnaJ2 [Actinomycetia bacterium]|nr:dnaJ2 [Actinomycetes bacterium]
MPPREWFATDYYGILGVQPTAEAAEIDDAYRALAKQLHPDLRPDDPAALERFKEIAVAHDVLGDPQRRVDYDRTRLAGPRSLSGGEWSAPGYNAPGAVRAPARPTAPTVPGVPARRFPRGRLMASGIALVLIGLVVGAWRVQVTRDENALWDHGLGGRSTVVKTGNGLRLRFTAFDGKVVEANPPNYTNSGAARYEVGEKVDIVYDKTNPQKITLNEDTTARDVTLWIVAIKLFLCGVILIWASRSRWVERKFHQRYGRRSPGTARPTA